MVPFISVTDCHGALTCRPLVSVPLGLPNVVTTPMLRVETIVVEPRISTKTSRPPAITAVRVAQLLAASLFDVARISRAITVTMTSSIAINTCQGTWGLPFRRGKRPPNRMIKGDALPASSQVVLAAAPDIHRRGTGVGALVAVPRRL